MFERSKGGENALLIHPHLVGPRGGGHDPEAAEEFAELVRSAGATVVSEINARLDKPSPSLLIGSGKLDEVKAVIAATGADLVLVNHALSPVQERNLERELKCRVVDRTGLILDIFALRARTNEGKLQVELAQLKHLSTRLVRGWTHLERQRGGAIGLRGPGEKQLELDRRMLQTKLESLQRRLDKVEVQRTQMRRARIRNEVPRVALVGYTNAGKSTLFNVLTGSGVYAADKLFATLDPTVRRVEGLACGPLVLADTVGFVRDLPHELVAAFRSTLAEAREADLLLHLVDAADPQRLERIDQVDGVLEEIGAGDIPQVLVFNKIDRVEGAVARRDEPTGGVEAGGRERVWISARDATGLDLLRTALAERFANHQVRLVLRLPAGAGRLRARLHELGGVLQDEADDEGWRIEVELPRGVLEQLAAGGDGEPLRAPLLAAHGPPSYNDEF